MQTIWQDLRFGLRLLRRNPGFTFITVLTLALGIGANAAIFSLVHAVLVRPLPFPDADRLVCVWEDNAAIGFPRDTPAPGNYADWKSQNRVFEDMAALDWRSFDLTGDGEPERISGFGATANLFPLLGVKPQLGRTFLDEEDRPGAPRVAVIGHRFWQRRFGGERTIINREILLNGEKYTVIGVMPADFQFGPGYISLWVPIALTPEELSSRRNHYLQVMARLKPGVTVAEANADIQTITRRIAASDPENAAQLGSIVVSLRDQVAGGSRRSLQLLLGAVGCVLLVACANIASLLLARASARRREMAVRAALGAGRLRIVRQLLLESVLLSGVGGIAGLWLASESFGFLSRLVPAGMALTTPLRLDAPVLLFTLGASLVAGLIFGLAPALNAARTDLNEVLKLGGPGGRGTGSGLRSTRSALVVAEVAMALVLLIGSGLLIQTLANLRGQYDELRPESVLTMRTLLPANRYATPAQRNTFYGSVLERVGALPGVVSAGYTTTVPLSWKGGANGIRIEGREPVPGAAWNANHRQVSDDYLKAMGIALQRGRYFNAGDNEQSMPVAIINETMARQYWPNDDPIGKRFGFGQPNIWRTIVGVVADVRQMGIEAPIKAEMYLPYRQIRTHGFFAPRDLVLRASGDPMSLVSSVRAAIREVDPELPVSNIQTLAEVLGEETAERRMSMLLLSVFAGLALLLAALGIYGVLSYFVTQRTPEIGVRLALGAERRDVLRLVMRQGMRLVLAGIGVGLLGAAAVVRLMSSIIYGVSPYDPLTFISIPALLTLVALLACWLPARRATKVDPMIALRYE